MTQENLSVRKVGIVQKQRSVLFQGSIRDNLKWGDENATDEDRPGKQIEIAQAKEVVEGKPGKLDFSWSRMDVICLVDRNRGLPLQEP